MTDQKLKAMQNVAQYAFAMYDAQLYLNVYSHCDEARNHYFEMKSKFKEAVEEYECMYGPLTAASDANRDSWTWSTDPWPWQIDEGGCTVCGRM